MGEETLGTEGKKEKYLWTLYSALNSGAEVHRITSKLILST